MPDGAPVLARAVVLHEARLQLCQFRLGVTVTLHTCLQGTTGKAPLCISVNGARGKQRGSLGTSVTVLSLPAAGTTGNALSTGGRGLFLRGPSSYVDTNEVHPSWYVT